MSNVHVLICPATSLTSVSAEVRYSGDQDGAPIPEYCRWLAIAYASTMTTLPIITMPVGKTKDGLPFSVQLIGNPLGDAKLFKVALKIEAAVGRCNKAVDPIGSILNI